MAARTQSRLTLAVACAMMHVAGVSGCTNSSHSLQRAFQDVDGCMVLLDASTGTIERYNPERCREAFSPCSTFKIPNSIIGLETGAIRDADEVIAWDGVQRDRPELNRDHTLRSAIAHSVVWYYQELARRVGPDCMHMWIDRLDYGNHDLTGGVTQFWLQSTLMISADQQVDFLRQLQTGSLPVSWRTQDIVREITPSLQMGNVIVHGKTGSGRASADAKRHLDLGWYVGWVEQADHVWVFAANASAEGVFGPQVRRRVLQALKGRGVLPDDVPIE
jgi:beta-lactamase class D